MKEEIPDYMFKNLDRNIYLFFRFIGRGFYRQFFALPIGFIYCCIKFRNRNVVYVLVCDHIGDTLFSLGYLKAFCEKENINRLAFVTTAHLMELTELYQGVIDERVVVCRYLIHLILDGHQTRIGILMYRQIDNFVIVEPANYVVGGFEFICKFPQVQLIDLIRYGVLGLDSTAQYMYPVYPVQAGIQEKGKVKVVLSPESQVTDALPKMYFISLANELLAKGYDVYTNISSSNGGLIPGTKPFCYGLIRLFELVQAENICFIGIRSGLLDLVQHAGGVVIALYPKLSKFQHFYAMGQGVLKGSSASQYTVTGVIQEDIRNILGLFMCLQERGSLLR